MGSHPTGADLVSTDLALLVNVLASIRPTRIENKSDELAARMRVTFANGYQASIVRGDWTNGADEGLFEAAVMHDGHLVYDTPITDDVIGWLDVAGVLEFCEKVAALPQRAASPRA
jgi:hypothetical protein